MENERKVAITTTLEPSVIKKLEIRAKTEGITLSSLIRKIIYESVKKESEEIIKIVKSVINTTVNKNEEGETQPAGDFNVKNLPDKIVLNELKNLYFKQGKNPRSAERLILMAKKRGKIKRVGRGIYQKIK